MLVLDPGPPGARTHYKAAVKLRVAAIDVPQACELAGTLTGSYFHDSYAVLVDTDGRSAMALYLAVAGRTPRWVEVLMDVRNRVVGMVGLKNLGQLGAVSAAKPASAYRVGDRVGIFSLLHLSEDEVVLGDSDKHLDVKVSVHKSAHGAGASVAVSTVVHVHNTLGKMYMFFVAPVHKRIVRTMLARVPLRAIGA
jgi:hypothetical protein